MSYYVVVTVQEMLGVQNDTDRLHMWRPQMLREHTHKKGHKFGHCPNYGDPPSMKFGLLRSIEVPNVNYMIVQSLEPPPFWIMPKLKSLFMCILPYWDGKILDREGGQTVVV